MNSLVLLLSFRRLKPIHPSLLLHLGDTLVLLQKLNILVNLTLLSLFHHAVILQRALMKSTAEIDAQGMSDLSMMMLRGGKGEKEEVLQWNDGSRNLHAVMRP